MRKFIHSKEYEMLTTLLRDRREEVEMTQAELAVRLETTQTIVSKCERGERRLDVIETFFWCQALEVSFIDFAEQLSAALASLD